jgi:hypothetical protein
MFLERKSGSSEVLSRAVLFTIPESGKVVMESTDGVFGMRSTVSATTSSQFPERCVLDMTALFRVARMCEEHLTIVYESGDFYAVPPFGGMLHIQKFNVSPDLIKFKSDADDDGVGVVRAVTGAKIARSTVCPEGMLSALSCASQYLSSVAVHELAFAHFTPQAMFLANGSSVFKMRGGFSDLNVRKSDIDTLCFALSSDKSTMVGVSTSKERLEFNGASFAIQLPNFAYHFSDSFTVLAKPAEVGYHMEWDRLQGAISILEEVTSGAGAVTLTGRDGSLEAEARGRDGKRSHVYLSTGESGPSFSISVGFPIFAAAARAMKGSALVKVGVVGSNLIINDEEKVLVVFGKVS